MNIVSFSVWVTVGLVWSNINITFTVGVGFFHKYYLFLGYLWVGNFSTNHKDKLIPFEQLVLTSITCSSPKLSSSVSLSCEAIPGTAYVFLNRTNLNPVSVHPITIPPVTHSDFSHLVAAATGSPLIGLPLLTGHICTHQLRRLYNLGNHIFQGQTIL